MDQGHLWAEESVRDRTRQLVLVEVTADKHSEVQTRALQLAIHSIFFFMFMTINETAVNKIIWTYKCLVFKSLSRPIPPLVEIGRGPLI